MLRSAGLGGRGGAAAQLLPRSAGPGRSGAGVCAGVCGGRSARHVAVYAALAALQMSLAYHYRAVLSGGSAGAGADGCATRVCELSAWAPGQDLPAWVPSTPETAWAPEWPPDAGPEFVRSTPGLSYLLAHDNDASVRRQAYGGRWRTPLVIVPAVYNEYDGAIPGWAVTTLFSRFRSLYLYQRRAPDQPRYAPNFGTESGVYYRFIVEHYDELPDVMGACRRGGG